MKINEQKKEALAEVLNYLFNYFESDYEETLNLHGPESEESDLHIYNLARNLWAEFELDL